MWRGGVSNIRGGVLDRNASRKIVEKHIQNAFRHLIEESISL